MYIKLEDAKSKIASYNKYPELTEILLREINSLPTINPTKIIEDMIEEHSKSICSWCESDQGYNQALEEALNKINQ